jgi:hypothetical protein
MDPEDKADHENQYFQFLMKTIPETPYVQVPEDLATPPPDEDDPPPGCRTEIPSQSTGSHLYAVIGTSIHSLGSRRNQDELRRPPTDDGLIGC